MVSIGAWLSLARALALGARGHRFKSCRPDHIHNVCLFTMLPSILLDRLGSIYYGGGTIWLR